MGDAATDDAIPTAEEGQEVPRDERREEILAEFTETLGDAVLSTHIDPGRDIWARVSSDAWADAGEVLRHRMGARYFGFLSAIDWMPSPFERSMDSEVDNVLGTADSEESDGDEAESDGAVMRHGVTGGESRFQLLARVARVGGRKDHWGITLKADVREPELSVATWTNLYAGADWHEREAWEMFGIEFVGHPGLRNMYLPTDFEGHPLRKDFPLVARMVKPWPGIVDVEALPTPAEGEAGASDSPADGSEDES